ncbi:MAG: Fe-S oxidoreductase [Rubripirellula sp.]
MTRPASKPESVSRFAAELEDRRRNLSPDLPYLVLDEQEADGFGGHVSTTTIFLTASQCPIGCNMCDLHHNTLLTGTPQGAIPKQIDSAMENRHARGWIKLYNSGNFFDPNSIPPEDYKSIADRCSDFSRVIVENHPRFGAERLKQFRELLEVPLEVAVGLETVQPRWLARMGKQMVRDRFDRYARWLQEQSVDLRVFLIVGVPGVSVMESIRWARLSVRHAVMQGARHVSLIPARAGHGWGGQANLLPDFELSELQDLLCRSIDDVKGKAVVTVDVWDADPLDSRLPILQRINVTQRPQ